MTTYKVQLSCGCCYEDVQFESEKSARKALDKAGLGSDQTLVDDTGREVHGVDTFYGLMKQDASTANPLGRLLDIMKGMG